MKKNKLTALLLSSLLVFTSSSAFAMQHKTISSERYHQSCEQSDNCPMASNFDGGLFYGISLSEEQRLKIEQIRTEEREKALSHKSNMKTMFVMHKEIKDLTFSKDFTEDKLNEIIKKYTNEISQEITYQANIENKIFNVLTDEQQDIYKENLNKWEKRVKGERFQHRKTRDHNVEAYGSDGKVYTKENIIR